MEKKKGTPLFWYVTQRKLVVTYRRFGTTYRSNLQESSSPRLECYARPLKIGPMGYTETSVTMSLRCVTSQKSADLI